MQLNQMKQKKNFDKHAKNFTPLEEGNTVRMKPFTQGNKKWSKATVTRRLDDRSYKVEANGTTHRCKSPPEEDVGAYPSTSTWDSSTGTSDDLAKSRPSVPGYC